MLDSDLVLGLGDFGETESDFWQYRYLQRIDCNWEVSWTVPKVNDLE